MLLILAAHTAFSQYPQTKKIKGDSVVILTVGQADTINQLYRSYNDTISFLKTSLEFKTNKYDSILTSYNLQKDSISNYKWKYKSNIDSYSKRQEDYWKTEKIHEVAKIVLVGIILIQFNTISQLQNQINRR